MLTINMIVLVFFLYKTHLTCAKQLNKRKMKHNFDYTILFCIRLTELNEMFFIIGVGCKNMVNKLNSIFRS